MRPAIYCALLLANGLLLSPTSATTPIVLEPTSAWEVDVADNACILRRHFSDGTSKLQFEIRQSTKGGVYDYRLISNELKQSSSKLAAQTMGTGFRIVVGSTGDYQHERTPAYYLTVNSIYLAPPSESVGETDAEDQGFTDIDRDNAERSVTGFVFDKGYASPVTVNTGPMHAPLQAMRGCVDDLLTFWGVDAEAHKTLRSAASMKKIAGVSRRLVDLFPRKGVTDRRPAAVFMAIKIDETGKAVACYPSSPDADKEVIMTACNNLMHYGEFNPAIDANGNPIATVISRNMVYSRETRSVPGNR